MRSILNYDDDSQDADIPELLSAKTKELTVVEEYFLDATKRLPIEISYDCTAEEPVYWNTLNYTTYAGCFIMHPLRGQAAHEQMIDAYADGVYNGAWVKHFKDKLSAGTASKYIKRSDKDVLEHHSSIDCLVVLAGHNKLAKHTCAGSLVRLHENYKNVVYKKHPISDQTVYDGLFNHLREQGVSDIVTADADLELYELTSIASNIATGFASESALYAAVEDVPIVCTDLYQNRTVAPFYHINEFLFRVENPKYFINKAFNSYKSGIINPDVDDNWQLKLDQYIEYIGKARNKAGTLYVS